MNKQNIREGIAYIKSSIKIPESGVRNILITSALPYVNNVPHLGNIIGSVLSADVYSRYCKQRGYNTLYICGTDEYGTATVTKANEEKISCQELCDKYYKLHAKVYEWFEISFDHFGRTSTPNQTEIAQDIFKKLYANKYIFSDSLEQLYCENCQMFLADRFVEGICPKCNYEDARGDQCDKCSHLINAIELKSPRCKVDGTQPVIRSSKHLFLDLPKLQSVCEEFTEKSWVNGHWSDNSISITKSWLKEGLKPRCITRDLKWGTPVPLEEFSDKVFYVWFDACMGYISITASFTNEWKKWWQNPDNVQLYMFMGKDNVPFHSVIFPCSLIGSKESWTLVHHINTTEYLSYENSKFSKSRSIGVFGTDAMSTNIPVEIWRYYLISIRPEGGDGAFCWFDFQRKINGELVSNLGNMINRALKFLKKNYNSIVPEFKLGDNEAKFIDEVNKYIDKYHEYMEAVKLRDGLGCIMRISTLSNEYLSENKFDNKLFTEHPDKCATVISVVINVIYLVAALIYSFMPSASTNTLQQLNAPLKWLPDSFALDILSGHTINEPKHLFSRLEDKVILGLKTKFSGSKHA